MYIHVGLIYKHAYTYTCIHTYIDTCMQTYIRSHIQHLHMYKYLQFFT